jgi:hypothetical protein
MTTASFRLGNMTDKSGGSLDKPHARSQHPRGMLLRVRNLWASQAGKRVDADAYFGAMLAVVLLGVFLRVNGWLGHHLSFWMDEALWASRVLHWPLLDLSIRPIGFVAITRVLVGLFGATEVWFRFLPAIGAIGSLLLMPYVASQLLVSKWLRLLLVLLFAIQPALVDYANEFKPYSWEVLVHLVPLVLYLRFRETGKNTWLFALLGYLPISFLLAYNMALAFPGLLLLCLGVAWRSQQRTRLVAATLASGALCASLGALMFELSLKNVTHEERTESYWGKKYDVFYDKKAEQSRASWTLQKYDDMAAFVGQRRDSWADSGKISEAHADKLGSVERLFWVGLSFIGLFALARKRRDLLLVLFAPLIMIVLANLAGKWPLGAFRTNIWVMVFTLPLPFLGLQLLAINRRVGAALLALVLGLTVVPSFLFGFDWHGHKRTFTRDFYEREVIAKLYAYRKEQLAKRPDAPRARLLLELHTWYPHVYYLEDHPEFRAKYAQFFADNFIVDRVSQGVLNGKFATQLRKAKGQGIWLVSSTRHEFDNMRRGVRRQAKVVIEEHVAHEHVIMYVEAERR